MAKLKGHAIPECLTALAVLSIMMLVVFRLGDYTTSNTIARQMKYINLIDSLNYREIDMMQTKWQSGTRFLNYGNSIIHLSDRKLNTGRDEEVLPWTTLIAIE